MGVSSGFAVGFLAAFAAISIGLWELFKWVIKKLKIWKLR